MRKILVFVVSLILLSASGLAATQTLVPYETDIFDGWNAFGDCAPSNDLWTCINDWLFSDGDLLEANGDGSKILFKVNNMSSSLGLADSVTFKYRSKAYSRGGPRCYFPYISVGEIYNASGTCNFGLAPTICDNTTSLVTHTFTSTVNPCTEQPWTFAEINAMKIGMESNDAAWPGGGRVDALWAVVNY